MLRDMLNKEDPVARKVLAYQDSKEFKKELDLLAERVSLGLSQEEFKKYKKSSNSEGK